MSVTSRLVEARADGRGSSITLGDLKEFVATLEAAGAANSTPIDGTCSWRGRLTAIKASAVRVGDNGHPGRT